MSPQELAPIGRWAYYRGPDPWSLTDFSALYCDFRFAPDAPSDLVIRFPDGDVKSMGNYPPDAVVIEVDSTEQDYGWALARYHEITAARQGASVGQSPSAS